MQETPFLRIKNDAFFLCGIPVTASSIYVFAYLRQTLFPDIDLVTPVIGFIAASVFFWFIFGATILVVSFDTAGAEHKRKLRRRFRQAGAWFVTTCVMMSVLYAFPWSARQRFFRHAATLSAGMTVHDVEKRFTRYHAIYEHDFGDRKEPSARPIPEGVSEPVFYLPNYPESEAKYRDWIKVTFKQGRVVEVVAYDE